MYRLTIRKQWFLFVGLLLLFLGLVIFLPSHSPDRIGKLSLSLILIVEVLLSFGCAYLFYLGAPLSEMIKAAATFLAIAAGIGTIGSLTSSVNQPLPGTDVLISWIQLAIMNLGGGLVTLALYEVQIGAGYGSMYEEAQDIVRTVKPRTSPAQACKLTAESEQSEVDISANAEQSPTSLHKASDLSVGRQAMNTPVSMPAVAIEPLPPGQLAENMSTTIPDMPLSKVSQPASSSAQPLTQANQLKRDVTITSQRIQVQSRRNTSTFTKLQALSASGRSLTAPAGSGQDAEGLKSILDRLEDQVEAASQPRPKPASQPPIAQIQSPTVDIAQADQTANEISPSPPADKSGLASSVPSTNDQIAKRLVSVINKNKMPALKKQVFQFDPEPTGKVEDQTSNLDSWADNTGQSGQGEDLSSDRQALVQEAASNPPIVEIKETEKKLSQITESTDLTDQAQASARSAQAQEDGENLFSEAVNSEIDEIFATLAPAAAQREVTHLAENRQALPAQTTELDRTATQPESGSGTTQAGLFGAQVNEEIDEIFAHLAPAQAQKNVSDRTGTKSETIKKAPQTIVDPGIQAGMPSSFSPSDQPEIVAEEAAVEAPQCQSEGQEEKAEPEEEDFYESPIVNPVTKNIEVREFGRLSAKSAMVKGPQNATGTMKTVGKLLIDVPAIENIIKGGETGKLGSGLASARIISTARGEGIKALLGKIDSCQGVTGCLIVGHDGLVIASTLASSEDKDALGALSSALLNTSNLATLKLEIGKLKQLVLLTNHVNGQDNQAIITVLTDVDVGVLAVFVDNQELDKLDNLLQTIHATIHG